MEMKGTEMLTIDAYDLNVEELEERLELAALFVTTPSNTSHEQVVAVDWNKAPNCAPSGPIVC